MPIKTIGLDADDTLWHNERLFRFTEAQFAEVLADYADPATLESQLLEVEKRNLALYGFGIKGFTLSMIETAIELTSGRVPTQVIKTILDAGRSMITHPVEIFDGVKETLALLKQHYQLILITKGDLFDQERKLAESGLGDMFAAVEVVSNKDRSTYETLFKRHAGDPSEAMMVGNSLKSDIIPALETGAWATYIPYDVTWVFEEAEEPNAHPRYRRVERLAQLDFVLQTLES